LLKGLLGETPSSQGFVYSSFPSTAYVDQTPWIQNGTIQQNILGVSTFDEPWYRQVVRACALEHDIALMPKGHGKSSTSESFQRYLLDVATPVGSAGISLSGGQKQRLALARSVYAKKELVFLDDVFSGLDAETEEQIFNRLLSKQGLFQQMGITVLLVTHVVRRLSYSNYVIALYPLGRIAEQGSFYNLRSSSGYVKELTSRLRGGEDFSSEDDMPIVVDPFKLVPTFPVDQDEFSAITEELNRQTGDFQVCKYYFTSIGWKYNILFIGCVILYGFAQQLTNLIVTYWTDAVAVHGNKVNAEYLGLYTLLSGLEIIGLVGGGYSFQILVVPKTALVLHERLLRTVMAAPLSFFTLTDTGTTTNR
jgi:ABC-type bacteriocin/lantibiotic exporter with double-glycine peptidase domain